MTLSTEESALIADIAQHPGRATLFAVMEELVRHQERAVLTYDLGSGKVETLVTLKSQAEGARKLLSSLASQLEQFRLGSLPPRRERSRAKQESDNPR